MYQYENNRLLNVEEAKEKRSDLLSIILDSIKQVKELENGYALRFSPGQNELLSVLDWIHVETICNAFLRFQLVVESNNGPIWLEMSGPTGVKDFLNSEFALSRWL